MLCIVLSLIHTPNLYNPYAINYIQSRLHTSHVYLALTPSEPSDICTEESKTTLYSLVLTLTKSQPPQVGPWPGLHRAHLSTKLNSYITQAPLDQTLEGCGHFHHIRTKRYMTDTSKLFQLLPRRAWCLFRSMGTYMFHGRYFDKRQEMRGSQPSSFFFPYPYKLFQSKKFPCNFSASYFTLAG